MKNKMYLLVPIEFDGTLPQKEIISIVKKEIKDMFPISGESMSINSTSRGDYQFKTGKLKFFKF